MTIRPWKGRISSGMILKRVLLYIKERNNTAINKTGSPSKVVENKSDIEGNKVIL